METDSTTLKSSGVLLIQETYNFELLMKDDDHIEFKARKKENDTEFAKTYTLYQLKTMSPLLFFTNSIQEVYEKLISKISNKLYKITDEDAKKHIHLHINFTIDGEKRSTAFKMLRSKEKPIEVNDVDGLVIKSIEEHQEWILLNLIKDLALYEKSPELVIIVEKTLKEDIFE